MELVNTFDENLYKPIKIKSIKQIKNNDNVYDLTVKDHGTYCIGDNIVGHNSDMGKGCCSLAA